MNEKEKPNRQRLGQNPFIDGEDTKPEIARRRKEFGMSLGVVIDEAIALTKAHYRNKEKKSQ